MSLSQEQLSRKLSPRPFRFYEQIQSTQDIALEWLRQNALQGAVVIADEQLAGRGRLNRTWHTPPDSAIALSFLIRPNIEQVKQVTMLGALAIAETLENLGLQKVYIKWPNDVRVSGKKISGVLPEAVWDGDNLLGVALGMGINIRVKFTDDALKRTAINVEDALGRGVDRVEFIYQLLERLDYSLLQLGSHTLFSAWKSRLETLGQQVEVSGQIGLAEDVDQEGSLLVLDSSGVLHRVLAGDVISGA